MLKHPLTSGIIFFAYNYKSPRQIKEMIDEVRSIREDIIISVDQEGGRVQRFDEGFAPLPPMQKIGDLYKRNKEEGLQAAYSIGRLCGEELREVGINLNYTPVLDIDHGVNPIILGRSFSSDGEAVAHLARQYLKGLMDAGVVGVGKHFPGHGGVADDSHHLMPEDGRSAAELEQDLAVYKSLIKDLPGIMTVHILFSKIDNKAVSFSSRWLKDKLRQEMGYDGTIISDDLSMGSARKAYGDLTEVAWAALAAGCDLILLCNDQDGAEKVLDFLAGKINGSAAMLAKMLNKSGSADAADFDMEYARNLAMELSSK